MLRTLPLALVTALSALLWCTPARADDEDDDRPPSPTASSAATPATAASSATAPPAVSGLAAPGSPPPAAAASAAATAPEAKASPAKAASAKDNEDDVHDRKPRKMKVGLDLSHVTKVDFGAGTFEADLVLSYSCSAEPCHPEPDFYNGELKGKPDLLVDEPLHKVMRLKAEFTADFDFAKFPFDTQVLELDLGDEDELDVTFEVDTEHTPPPSDVKLAGWQFLESGATVVTEDVGDGVKVQHFNYTARMSRPAVSAITKNFLPPLTMVLVLLVSLVMRPKMAAPRLAAGTGSFVGVIMFHNTATNQLPPLGALTTLDRFMFGLYLLWIVHIALSIGILRADEQKNDALGEKFYKAAWVVVPLFVVVLTALTFAKVL